jgi:hypothetical protein
MEIIPGRLIDEPDVGLIPGAAPVAVVTRRA